jgi:KaiC/GvpD/RAD55 family RecA-like ATPase
MSEQFCVECYTYGAIHAGVILIEGPPAAGKSSLVKAFVRLAIQNEQPVVYVSSQASPDEVRSGIGEAMGTQITPEKLSVLDCFSSPTTGTNTDYKAFSTANLSEVSIELQSTLGKLKQPYVVFDSIDPFVLDTNEDVALKFFRTTLVRVKGKNATGSATLTTGVHSARFQAALRTIFQGILELKLEEARGKLQRFVRIFALKDAAHTTDWFPFQITEEGIMIGAERYREGLPPRHKDLHFLRFTH